MASLNVITIRLLPQDPVEEPAFNDFLKKISIKAWDLTVADSVKGVLLGQAKGKASDDMTEDLVIVTDPNSLPRLETPIIQHWETVTTTHPPLPPTVDRVRQSVATAVIVADIKPPHPDPRLEYPNPNSYDLRLEVSYEDEVMNLEKQNIDFNVNVSTLSELSKNRSDYLNLPISTHVLLPVTLTKPDPSRAFIALKPDGTPPSFDQVQKAVDLVLAKDHPIPGESPSNLLNLAYYL